MMDDDNFEFENDDHEKVLFNKSLNRMLKPLKQEGFREGVSAGKDNTFQKGFDKGYSSGFHVGDQLGYFNGVQKILYSKGILHSHNGFEDPSRGFCILCTDKKAASEDNLERNVNESLNIINEKQNALISTRMEEKQDKEYKDALKKLGLPLK